MKKQTVQGRETLMKNLMKQIALAIVAMAMAGNVGATTLTFDVFYPDTNTIYTGGYGMMQSYGDNVTDFSPPGIYDTYFHFQYGSGGGYTPDIAVSYRKLSKTDPTNPDPSVNGEPVGVFDNSGPVYFGVAYGATGLTNVVFNSGYATSLLEIRFTPDATHAVTINSFDVGGYYAGGYSGDTIKIMADPNSASPLTLWQAGPDGAVNVANPTTFTPAFTGAAGQSISLVWDGNSSNGAIDNISFSEVIPVPEPSSVALLTLGGLLVLRRYRTS